MDDNTYNSENIPFLRLIQSIFFLAQIALMVYSFGLACFLVPGYYRSWKQAKSSNERFYFALRFCAATSFVYMCLLIVIPAIFGDQIFNDGGSLRYWPTLSWLVFMNWDMRHIDSCMLDVFLFIGIGVTSVYLAGRFGNEDSGEFQVEGKKQAKSDAAAHINDVMDRYAKVKANDPRLVQGYNDLTEEQQQMWLAPYLKQLADIEDRVRSVHQLWKRKCPI